MYVITLKGNAIMHEYHEFTLFRRNRPIMGNWGSEQIGATYGPTGNINILYRRSVMAKPISSPVVNIYVLLHEMGHRP